MNTFFKKTKFLHHWINLFFIVALVYCAFIATESQPKFFQFILLSSVFGLLINLYVVKFLLRNNTKNRTDRLFPENNHKKFYETILNSLTEGVVIYDSEGKIVQFNQSTLQILCLSEEQLLNRKNLQAGWMALKEDGTIFTDEEYPSAYTLNTGQALLGMLMEVRTSHKGSKWLRINSVPFKLADGKLGALVTFSEISDFVNKKKKLAESERVLSKINQSLHLVLEGTKLSTWEWNILKNELVPDQNFSDLIGQNIRETKKIAGWDEMIHPEDRIAVFRELGYHISGKNSFFESTHRIKHKNGSWIWVFARGKISERESNGRVIKLIGTYLDIGASKELEERLTEAQKVAKVGSWRYDIQSGKISWTKQMYELFPENINDGEPNYEKHRSSIYAEDLALWENTVKKCIRDGAPYTIKFRSVFPDKLIWIEARGEGKKNEKGEVIAIHGTCQDITERIKMEDENRFIIDALKIGIWKFNPNNNALFWDKSMYTLFGINESDFSGHYEAWESSLTPESKEKAVAELKSALNGEKEFDTTFTILKNNEEVHIGGRGRVIRDEKGAPLIMYGMNWDKTNEVNLKKSLEVERAKALQTAKLASLGEMSAGIAHEINNPLAIISGAVLLLNKVVNDPVKFEEKQNVIKKAVARIAKIVFGLRKFSRSTETRNLQPAKIANLVNEVIVLTEHKAKRNSVKLFPEIKSDSEINCDEVEIEQVLVNLINNAIDATRSLDEKWVKIEVFDEMDAVVLRVIDSGKGIDPNVAQKLFIPFFTTKAVGEGTGLGLSITKGILDEHKASIQLLNNYPNTCFELRFQKHEVRNVA